MNRERIENERMDLPSVGISSLCQMEHLDVAHIDRVDNDIVLFDTGNILSLISGPNKLEGVCVGLCVEGSARFFINLREYELKPGRMVVALPNQLIENSQVNRDFKGVFFSISKTLLDGLPRMGNVLSLFFYLKDYPCIDLTSQEQGTIESYHVFIRNRLKDLGNVFRREAVLGLMQGFFYDLCNIFRAHAKISSTRMADNKSRKAYIFECFYKSLVESYQMERSVKFYADRMCLTPKHLSGVVKEVSGKTVGAWIDEMVILEAKALLNSTSMNIQEIADRLNFANQSFFGKYFKHCTGISPKEYRKLQLSK